MQTLDYICVAADVRLGVNVRLSNFVNLYGCELGDDTRVGAFVEVQRDVRIGRRCKISSLPSYVRASRSRTKFSSAMAWFSSTIADRARPTPMAPLSARTTG